MVEKIPPWLACACEEGKGRSTSYPLSHGANPEIKDGLGAGLGLNRSSVSSFEPLSKLFGTVRRAGSSVLRAVFILLKMEPRHGLLK